jgi:hypothetical protein
LEEDMLEVKCKVVPVLNYEINHYAVKAYGGVDL